MAGGGRVGVAPSAPLGLQVAAYAAVAAALEVGVRAPAADAGPVLRGTPGAGGGVLALLGAEALGRRAVGAPGRRAREAAVLAGATGAAPRAEAGVPAPRGRLGLAAAPACVRVAVPVGLGALGPVLAGREGAALVAAAAAGRVAHALQLVPWRVMATVVLGAILPILRPVQGRVFGLVRGRVSKDPSSDCTTSNAWRRYRSSWGLSAAGGCLGGRWSPGCRSFGCRRSVRRHSTRRRCWRRSWRRGCRGQRRGGRATYWTRRS